MAERRSSIVLVVEGMQDLKKLNTELNTHSERMRAIETVYKSVTPSLNTLSGTFQSSVKAVTDLNTALAAHSTELKNLKLTLDNVGTGAKSTFATLNTQLSTNRDRAKELNTVYERLEAAFGRIETRMSTTAGAFTKQATLVDTLMTEVRRLREEMDKLATANKNAASSSPVAQSVNNTTQSVNNLRASSVAALTTMLQYRVVSAIFSGITNTIHEATAAIGDYDKQARRSVRVLGEGRYGVTNAMIREGAIYSGMPNEQAIKQAGETYYQLGTFIQKDTDLAAAFRSEMALLAGTEGDARTVARASIQVYQEFGDQLNKNISDGEKFRRVNELLAESFKSASSELNENADALKYLAPTAKTARIEVEQLMAVMTTLTAEGVRGRMSGTEATSFVTRLIKSYDTEQKGIGFKGNIYHFDYVKNAQGGLDILRTLESIYRTHEELLKKDTNAADKYYTAIGGSAQAIRFLGALSDDVLKRMYDEEAKNKEITAGHTREVEKLAETMRNSFSAQASAAWTGFLGDISRALEGIARQLGVIQMLGRIVDNQNLRAQQVTEEAQRDQQLRTEPYRQHLASMRGIAERARNSTRIDNVHSIEMMHLYDAVGQGNIPVKRIRELLSVPDANALFQEVPVHHDNSFFANLARYGGNADTIDGDYIRRRDLDLFLHRIRQQQQQPNVAALADAGASGAFASGTAGNVRQKGYQGAAVSVDTKKDDKKSDREQEREERQREIDQMERLRNKQEEARNAVKNAQKDLKDWLDEVKEKGLPDDAFTKAYSPLAKAVETAQNRLQNITATIAQAQNDTATLKQIRTRGLFERPDSEEATKENRKVYLGRQSDLANYYAELAREKYGVGSPQAFDRAMQAQQLAISKERAENGEGPQLWKLLDFKTGPFKEFMEAFEEVTNTLMQKQKDLDNWMKENGSFINIPGLPIPITQKAAAQQLMSHIEEQMKGVGADYRPNNFFRSNDQKQNDQIAQMQQRIDILNEGLRLLGPETQANKEQFRNLTDQLDQATKSLRDFNDSLAGERFQRQLKIEAEKTQDAITRAQNRTAPRGRRTEEQKLADDVEKLADIVRIREADLNRLMATPEYSGKEDAVEEARRRLSTAQKDLAQYPEQWYQYRYDAQYASSQQSVVGAGMELFSGKTGFGDVVRKLGDSIVSTAQQQFLKALTDPLTQTITKEILALEGVKESARNLTQAVNSNTTAIAGGSAVASSPSSNLLDALNGNDGAKFGDKVTQMCGVIDAVGSLVSNVTSSQKEFSPFENAGALGASLGATSGSKSGLNQADQAYTVASKYLGATLGAYSVFSQGQQQGINVGNVLGGAAAGAGIGSAFGPGGAAIGAGVGALVDVIGGLFHHSSPPNPHKEFNPVVYNSPSSFEYNAYRYRATGAMPTAKDMGITLPGAAPIINIHIDGVKRSVDQAITSQLNTSSASMTNAYVSYHEPI